MLLFTIILHQTVLRYVVLTSTFKSIGKLVVYT